MTITPVERPTGQQEAALTLELSRLLRISTRFAKAFALRFAERSSSNAFLERPLLEEAIAHTREWRITPFPPLPPAPSAGFPQEELTPDLMVAGIGQGRRWLFQLIVDVRVSAPLGSTWIRSRKMARPAAHAAVWHQIAAKDAAELRYVGTLSQGGAQADWRDDFDRLRLSHVRAARDVQWVPELDLTVRQAVAEMPVGERNRFQPELKAFMRQASTIAPELGLGAGGGPKFVHALASRRTRWQRERAAARTA